MTPGIGIWRCANCFLGLFPQPMLCPRCHGAVFGIERIHDAVVEEISTIHHMIGQENWKPRRIASVRTSDSQLVTVGLIDDSKVGSAVQLFEDGTAPVGRVR